MTHWEALKLGAAFGATLSATFCATTIIVDLAHQRRLRQQPPTRVYADLNEYLTANHPK